MLSVVDELPREFILYCLLPHVVFQHLQVIVQLDAAVLLMQYMLSFHWISQVNGLPILLVLLLLHEVLFDSVLLILLVQFEILDEGAIYLIVEMRQIFDNFGLFAENLLLFGTMRSSDVPEHE